MKGPLRLVCLSMAAAPLLSLAVFDLTWARRYNPSQLVATAFQSVVSNNAGGFTAAGRLSRDIVIADFDVSGNLLKSKIWDTPYVGEQSSVALKKDASDNRYFLSRGFRDSQLVKMDGNLNVLFEIDLLGDFSDLKVDALQSRLYVRSFDEIRCYSLTGTLIWSIDPGMDVFAMEPDSGGFLIVGGQHNAMESIKRLSAANGALVHFRKGTGATNSERRIHSLMASGGMAVAMGVSWDGSTPHAAIFTLNSSGVFTTALSTNLPNSKLDQISFVGNTVYRGILSAPTIQSRVVNVDRVSGSATFSYLPPGISGNATYYGPAGAGKMVVSHEPDSANPASATLTVWDTTTQSVTDADENPEARYGASTTFGIPARGVIVGRQPGGIALLQTVNPSGILVKSTYQLSGGPDRNLVSALPLAAGAYALVYESNPVYPSSGSTSTVVKYLANGNVAWAKTLASPGGEAFRAVEAAIGPDGAIVIAGSGASGSSARVFKVNSTTGAQLYTKAITDDEGIVSPMGVAVAADNSIFLIGRVFAGVDSKVELLLKLSANGTESARQKTVTTYTPDYEALHVAPGGNVVVLYRGEDSSILKQVQIKKYDPVTLAVEGSNQLLAPDSSDPTHLAWGWDSQSHFIVGVSYDGIYSQVFRFNPGEAVTPNFSQQFAGNWQISAVGSSPARDRIYMSEGTGSRLVSLRLNGVIDWFAPYVATVAGMRSLDVDSAGNIYVFGTETVNNILNAYIVKHLPSGVRSAQRRLAGRPFAIDAIPSQGYRAIGMVGTRNKGWGPFITRYD